MLKTWLAASLALLLLATSGQVRAGEACKTPQECFQKAISLMNAKDFKGAMSQFSKLCAANFAGGCFGVAQLHENGQGTPKNLAKAIELYGKACKLGAGGACQNLGLVFRHDKKDEAKAMASFLEGCKLKFPKSCYLVGISYVDGTGVAKDLKKAIGFLKSACDMDDPNGCRAAGVVSTTLKKPADATAFLKKALALFTTACKKQRDIDSCHEGGLIANHLGMGKEALSLEMDACKAKVASACTTVGVLYVNGKNGVTKDLAKAKKFMKLGCAGKDQLACENLANLTGKSSSGQLEGKIAKKKKKVLTIKITGGSLPSSGAKGELTKYFKTGFISGWLTIAVVSVKSAKGKKAVLKILEEKSKTVVDGKKVNHFKKGTRIKLKW